MVVTSKYYGKTYYAPAKWMVPTFQDSNQTVLLHVEKSLKG